MRLFESFGRLFERGPKDTRVTLEKVPQALLDDVRKFVEDYAKNFPNLNPKIGSVVIERRNSKFPGVVDYFFEVNFVQQPKEGEAEVMRIVKTEIVQYQYDEKNGKPHAGGMLTEASIERAKLKF